jgi:drug/metabolite transporter (DMT)-like permease
VTAIILAAVSALVWGTADFCGGKGTQRANALAVTVVSQVAGLPVLIPALLLIPGTPRLADMLWGLGAGVAGLFGIALLYRGLAGGAMVVVAPVTAVTAAVLPLGAGLVLDGAVPALALAGAGCAILAIALISLTPHRDGGPVTRGLIGLALAAGALFGIFFILLGQVHPDSGMWMLVGVRLSSVPVGLLLAARTRTSLRLPRPALRWALAAGPLDIAANALFVAAAARGHLGIVAVIASLYPASTVLLALAVDRERIRLVQVAGLGLAAVALVLVAT